MNVLIVDDHSVLFEGIERRILNHFSNANCVFVTTACSFMEELQKHDFDLVICDLQFTNRPEKDGFYIVKKVLKFKPNVKIIAYTAYYAHRIMKRALSSGFHSFMSKCTTEEEFLDTLKGVLKYGNYESSTMKKLRKERNQKIGALYSDSLYGISSLSKRELQLVLACKNTTDRNILAEKMNIGTKAIDTYFQRIIKKLDLRDRKEVQHFCIEFYDEIEKL